MKLSLVIPFVDQVDITNHCVETALKNAGSDFDLLLIDNGSDKGTHGKIMPKDKVRYIRNAENTGVLPTFKQGFEKTDSDIICFIHNDVLLHHENWVQQVINAFENNPKLGLAGIFGAVGVGENGGRIRSMSQMLGKEWGKCECHEIAWQHHSEFLDGMHPAVILDAVGLFFSREAANSLIQSDMFDSWRALNHFHDRTMPLKLIDRGFKIATIGLQFDHWSGATANSSEKWRDVARKWCEKQGLPITDAPDHDMYLAAEKQFFNEFGKRLPCMVDSNWDYRWTGLV